MNDVSNTVRVAQDQISLMPPLLHMVPLLIYNFVFCVYYFRQIAYVSSWFTVATVKERHRILNIKFLLGIQCTFEGFVKLDGHNA